MRARLKIRRVASGLCRLNNTGPRAQCSRISGAHRPSMLSLLHNPVARAGDRPKYFEPRAHESCQASKTAFRSRCARPGGTLHTCVSEAFCPNIHYPAARARASYWFDKHERHTGLATPSPNQVLMHARARAVRAAALQLNFMSGTSGHWCSHARGEGLWPE